MQRRDVQVQDGEAVLAGTLSIPEGAKGVALFAHGSGSSRFSPRNQFVAEHLQQSGLGTLLMDLLTEQEEAVDVRTAELRFDIDRLARRVIAAVDWVAQAAETANLATECFGASTGAAAALVAGAERPQAVGAVVSRGGRPDLAGASLGAVKAPTLLIVGGADHQVLELNRRALGELGPEAELKVVEGATHLFEEPGALEEEARLAAGWFHRFL
jgi:putative phosphoribosyl transferase